MDTLFFWTSKLVWLIVSPGSLLVWLLLASWLLSLSRWKAAGRRLLTFTALATLIIAYLPIGKWLLYPLEQRFPPIRQPLAAPDGIVLLGGSFSLMVSENRQQIHLTSSGERVLAFQDLAQRYPQAQLVFTGGSGNPTFQEVREADLARDLFQQLGIDNERVVYERESRNSYENARNTRALIAPEPDQNWLLVTSAFHLPRAMGAFCRQGWKVQAYPVDYRTLEGRLFDVDFNLLGHLNLLDSALHEWVGLLAYRLTGKTNRLFPGPTDTCTEQ